VSFFEFPWYMKYLNHLLLCIGSCILATSSAIANPIVGTIGFNVDGAINPSSGSLNLAFSITDVVTNTTASGNWNNVAFTDGLPVAPLIQFQDVTSSLNSTVGFDDPGFGKFEGRVVFDSGELNEPSGIKEREIIVLGDFRPGSVLVAANFTDVVRGQLSVIIQSINGGGRSSSVVFGTTAVPEPGSVALVALGVSVLGARLYSRAQKGNRRENMST
jgi:hypothetical protein